MDGYALLELIFNYSWEGLEKFGEKGGVGFITWVPYLNDVRTEGGGGVCPKAGKSADRLRLCFSDKGQGL